MFSLSIPLSLAVVDALKADLRSALPDVRSSHRVEALGRGLGFGSYAALRTSARAEPEALVQIHDEPFCKFLTVCGMSRSSIPLVVAVTRVAVRRVMDRFPDLCLEGFGVRPEHGETPRQRYARFMRSRADLLRKDDFQIADGIGQFLRSLAALDRVRAIKSINTKIGSYGLKHIAEHVACSYPDGTALGPNYVAMGAVIAAAAYRGFQVQRAGLGAYFNISNSSMIDLDCAVRPDGRAATDRARKAAQRQQRAENRAAMRALLASLRTRRADVP